MAGLGMDIPIRLKIIEGPSTREGLFSFLAKMA